jgi:pSer/pThr/pTyr-binding forkhead associated (FHA) protein
VLREQTTVRILDDRSLNGVFVNGERVTARELQDGDVVMIGRNELTFEAPVTRRVAA